MKKSLIILFLLGLSQLGSAQKAEAIEEYNSGLQYYNMHNYKDAIPFFEAAIKKDNTFVYAFRVLISCHEALDSLSVGKQLIELLRMIV